jgi:NAD(P)-dependent dehydrogenase (short-subunit alcohol dehydrogenase family)
MVERTRAEFGQIDVLVNNAGIYRAATTIEVTGEHWDAVMNVNAKAVFFASQAVLPTMIAQKQGVIVSLASMAGKIGSRANLPYNAGKAAVISMTKSLALAHAGDGIRVNCVCPGFVETDCGRPWPTSRRRCSTNRRKSSLANDSGRFPWDAWSAQRMSPT